MLERTPSNVAVCVVGKSRSPTSKKRYNGDCASSGFIPLSGGPHGGQRLECWSQLVDAGYRVVPTQLPAHFRNARRCNRLQLTCMIFDLFKTINFATFFWTRVPPYGFCLITVIFTKLPGYEKSRMHPFLQITVVDALFASWCAPFQACGFVFVPHSRHSHKWRNQEAVGYTMGTTALSMMARPHP
jgi:hypothetical protein